MQSEIKTVGRHTLVYGAGVILGKLAGFLMLPVYTRYLSPADYGVLELLGTTIDVIAMIAGIGLASGVFKFYAEAEGAAEKREVMSTAALGSAGLALLTTLLGIAFAEPLTRLVFGSEGEPLYFRLFFLTYFLQAAGGVPLMLIRAQNRSTLFVALNVAKLVAMLSLNIYLVVFLRMGVLGVLISTLIVTGVLAVVLSAYAIHQVGFAFSWARFRRLSEFGAPLIAWSIGSFILTFSDRYFLNYYTNAATVGVYSLAYKFSFVLSAFAVAPFDQVWEPRRFVIANQPNAQEVYRRMFLYLNLALVGGSILILLFVKDMLRVMSAPAFHGAYHVVPLLLIVTVVQQWTGYCNIGLYLKNATGLYAWSAVIAVVFALGLNALLIPRFGMFGAAWATVGAYGIRFAAVYWFAQGKYRIEYPWGKVAALGGVFGGAWLLRSLADRSHALASLGGSLGVSTAILLGAVVILYTQMLTDGERAVLRNVAMRPFVTRRIRTA